MEDEMDKPMRFEDAHPELAQDIMARCQSGESQGPLLIGPATGSGKKFKKCCN
jgi:hypothetical protein